MSQMENLCLFNASLALGSHGSLRTGECFFAVSCHIYHICMCHICHMLYLYIPYIDKNISFVWPQVRLFRSRIWRTNHSARGDGRLYDAQQVKFEIILMLITTKVMSWQIAMMRHHWWVWWYIDSFEENHSGTVVSHQVVVVCPGRSSSLVS